jgi:ABC-2 type transport system ATP-binding protein
VLDAVDLRKSYGRVPALRGFTLHVRPGEIVGLVGHNGAGKTTFTNIVSGLSRPDGGTITVAGRRPRAARGLIGVAPQHLALFPGVTVRETLRLFGGLAGLRRRDLAAAMDETVRALRLAALLDRRIRELSGGQQRRAQVATAMLHRPALLLLDEPTAGVDPETRRALLDAVRARAAAGAAVVYTTHYLPELADLGATIAVARQGRILARGTAPELLGHLPGQVRISLDGEEEIEVSTMDPAATLAELLRTVPGPVRAVDLRRPTLDDLYQALGHAG